ncbi:MAG: hypothetical protein EOP61_33955 [Sphingomonadales bacterium]|nr:MAG: hypothetical protein EOP61_33955 [Sphingomonadales bacterium]
MHVALRLLLALSLIWCGLHVAEPAQAGAAHADQSQVAKLLDADCGEERGEPASHAHHHHCPVAPDPAREGGNLHRLALATAPFAQPTAALRSLSRAPPLQPPSA